MLRLANGIESHEGAPSSIPLKSGTTVFGRDKSVVDVFIDSKTPKIISRLHATIKHLEESNEFILTSQGVNGVLVNEYAVNRVTLASGDRIVFGGAGATTKQGTRIAKSKSELLYEFVVEPPRPVIVVEEMKLPGPVETAAEVIVEEGCSCIPGMCSCVNQITKEEIIKIESNFTNKRRKVEDEIFIVDSPPRPTDSQIKTEVETARRKVLDNVGEDLRCCVCCELMVSAHALPCAHSFCKDCIFQWMTTHKDSPTCPECRAKIVAIPTPIRALDNTIDRVCESSLTPEELEDRKKRIEAAKKIDFPNWKNPKPSASSSSSATTPAANAMAALSNALLARGIAAPANMFPVQYNHDDEDDDEDDYDESEDDTTWEIEYAASGRSTCRSCHRTIANKELRWKKTGSTQGYDYYQSTHYFHYGCTNPPFSSSDYPASIALLSRIDQGRVRRAYP